MYRLKFTSNHRHNKCHSHKNRKLAHFTVSAVNYKLESYFQFQQQTKHSRIIFSFTQNWLRLSIFSTILNVITNCRKILQNKTRLFDLLSRESWMIWQIEYKFYLSNRCTKNSILTFRRIYIRLCDCATKLYEQLVLFIFILLVCLVDACANLWKFKMYLFLHLLNPFILFLIFHVHFFFTLFRLFWYFSYFFVVVDIFSISSPHFSCANCFCLPHKLFS